MGVISNTREREGGAKFNRENPKMLKNGKLIIQYVANFVNIWPY